MKLSLSVLAAFAATVLAQTADFDPVTKPLDNEKIPAGETYEIVWQAPAKYAEGTVSLHLIGGESQGSQVPLADIAAGIPNSAEKYSWAVDAALGDAKVYGLVIKYESDPAIFQYSNPFHIVKAEGGDSADTTTTISKSYGEKTITLSSCDCEETSTSSIVTPPPVSTPTPTTTPAVNSTTTYVKPTTVKTKPLPTTTVEVVTPNEPTEPATVPEEGAGARFGASSVALVGAFVVAAFAL
jgi:hypothetical protein